MTQTKIDLKVKQIIAFMERAIDLNYSYENKFETIKEMIQK